MRRLNHITQAPSIVVADFLSNLSIPRTMVFVEALRSLLYETSEHVRTVSDIVSMVSARIGISNHPTILCILSNDPTVAIIRNHLQNKK